MKVEVGDIVTFTDGSYMLQSQNGDTPKGMLGRYGVSNVCGRRWIVLATGCRLPSNNAQYPADLVCFELDSLDATVLFAQERMATVVPYCPHCGKEL